ncbi:uncharacterized protein LOC106466785 [Limulus polyphemus]|uniref:Uncharacterized protein LOC106466785 n=1 Tax=Limulus polyphemus TaxID=6850 RepID=A0ABM1BI93_LIMPO|nr:uncharacterized protein LOC106466785 [Limulus polyphemus]
MEGDSSHSTTTGTLSSRTSPIGWEKTPPMDVLENVDKEESMDDDHSSEFSTCSETDSKLLEEVKRQGMGLPPTGRIRRQKSGVLSITSPTKPLKYKAKDVLSGKAKMKLSIYKNCGLVTVHVMRAAYLSHRYRQVNAYVKVSIYPEEGQQTSWKTSIVKGSNNPVFDQKLSL